MSVALILLGGWAIARFGPALLVHLITTLVALRIVSRSRAQAGALIAAGPRRAMWDRPSRAERRLLASSLDLALDMTTFTSLYPTAVVRAVRLGQIFRRAAV